MGETEVRDTWTFGNKVFPLKITGWLFFGFCNGWKIKAIMLLTLNAWLQHSTVLKKGECSQCENDAYFRNMLLNFKIKHWEWSVLVVASINFSNKGRTRSSNGHHRKHSSTPLLFSPESKGNTRWPKYKPTAFSLPYQTCLLRYKPKLASCHGCHWSFEIMIKWSYERFWSQYYMFLGESFVAEFLGNPLSCQLR